MKGYLKLALIFIASAGFGFAASYIGLSKMKNISFDGMGFGLFQGDAIPIVLMIISAPLLIASIYGQFRSKKVIDEERSEKIFGNVMAYIGFSVFISLIAFSLVVLHLMQLESLGTTMYIVAIVSLVLFLVSMIYQYVILAEFNKRYPKRTVDLVNGTASGKDYVEKLDEAEKYIVYKSSYKAFNAQNLALYILTIVTLGYSMLFEFQAFPFILLLILFIVNNVAYYREANKHY